METQYTKHTPKVDTVYIITFFVLSIGVQWCKQISKIDLSTDLWVKMGAIILVFGIANSLFEKYKTFGLMTRENRNNLLIVNSCIPGTLGVVLVSDGYLMNVIVTAVVLIVLGVGRYLLDKKRCDKFNNNIGKKGVAETSITDKGQMRVSANEILDVTVISGMIKKGTKIEVTGMVGYKLVVDKITKK